MSGACPRLGYHVVMDVRPGASPAVREELFAAWTGFLEGRGLYGNRRGGAARLEYVVASEASQATNGDRVATEGWLASRREISAWRVEDLEDLDQAG
jgi:hypothetical protein